MITGLNRIIIALATVVGGGVLDGGLAGRVSPVMLRRIAVEIGSVVDYIYFVKSGHCTKPPKKYFLTNSSGVQY